MDKVRVRTQRLRSFVESWIQPSTSQIHIRGSSSQSPHISRCTQRITASYQQPRQLQQLLQQQQQQEQPSPPTSLTMASSSSRLLLRTCLPAVAASTAALAFINHPSAQDSSQKHRDKDSRHTLSKLISSATFPAAWDLSPNKLQCEKKRSSTRPPRHRYDTVDNLQDTRKFALIPVPTSVLESSHVIYGQLLQDDLVEAYKVYKKLDRSPDDPVVVAAVQLGNSLDGHQGVVHGGILALLMDDVLGFGFYALDVPYAVTANLNINYRRSVPSGSVIRIYVYLQERVGRKLYWRVEMRSPDSKIAYCDATGLFIIPKHIYDQMNESEDKAIAA
jgi:acyl-coenzyme A thioesterase PaaI-like protein